MLVTQPHLSNLRILVLQSTVGLCFSSQGMPRTMSCLAIGTTSRTISSLCSGKHNDSGIVSLLTSGRAEPSTATSPYPPDRCFRVANPCCCTNRSEINIPLAPESIIAGVSYPLTMHLVRKTVLVVVRAIVSQSSCWSLGPRELTRFLSSSLVNRHSLERSPS